MVLGCYVVLHEILVQFFWEHKTYKTNHSCCWPPRMKFATCTTCLEENKGLTVQREQGESQTAPVAKDCMKTRIQHWIGSALELVSPHNPCTISCSRTTSLSSRELQLIPRPQSSHISPNVPSSCLPKFLLQISTQIVPLDDPFARSLARNPAFLSHQNCCKTIYPPCNTLCVWAPEYPRTSSTIKSFCLFFQAIRPKLSLLLLPSSISCCEIPSSRSLIFSTSSA